MNALWRQSQPGVDAPGLTPESSEREIRNCRDARCRCRDWSEVAINDVTGSDGEPNEVRNGNQFLRLRVDRRDREDCPTFLARIEMSATACTGPTATA